MYSSTINFKKLWRPVLLSVALLFLYFPVLTKLVYDWSTDENYSHGLLIPFVIGYIVWINRKRLAAAATPKYIVGGIVTVAAIFVLLAGSLGAELFAQRISFVIILAGIIIYFYGIKVLRLLAIPFILLMLSIPIPMIIFNKIAFPLQIYASQLAVWGIRMAGVPTLRNGNVIEILPRNAVQVVSLEVVEACSGIRSLMTLVTLALVLVYFTRTNKDFESKKFLGFFWNKDFWRGALLMLSALPIAIFTNGARVAVTGILTYFYGTRATKGLAHDAAGWLVYLVALFLLIALNLILLKIFGKEKANDV